MYLSRFRTLARIIFHALGKGEVRPDLSDHIGICPISRNYQKTHRPFIDGWVIRTDLVSDEVVAVATDQS